MNNTTKLNEILKSDNDNKVNTFLNEMFGEVRTIIKNDQLWFVAQDIAQILEYKNTADMIKNLDTKEKDIATCYTPGGNQEMIIINESGLYTVILRITKKNKARYDKAKEFKEWITNEVIPSLRKNSFYIEGQERYTEEEFNLLKQIIENRDQLIANLKFINKGKEIINGLKDNKIGQLQKEINLLNSFLDQMAPKTLYELKTFPFSVNYMYDYYKGDKRKTKSYNNWINGLNNQYLPSREMLLNDCDLNKPLILFLYVSQYKDMDLDNGIKSIQDQLSNHYKINDVMIRSLHTSVINEIDARYGHNFKEDNGYICFGVSNYNVEIQNSVLDIHTKIYTQEELKTIGVRFKTTK